MEDWLKTVFLGVVEGVTEFLPISSTGHLVVVSELINFPEKASLRATFDVFIQFGAVLAVIAFYAADLLAQARELPHNPNTRRFWLAIFIAFLPAAIVGLALRDFIKNVLLASPSVVAISLIVGGLVLIVVERLPRPKVTEQATAVTLRQALLIGLAQVVSLVPGVSRSGATIVGGLLAGLERPAATTFAFYLAIPTLGAATLFDLARSFRDLSPSDLGYLIVGTAVTGVVAWLSIGWLLRYVAHHSFVVFGVYRIVAGVVVLALVAANVLPA